MRNEVVKRVCVRVLKNYLVRCQPCEPVALGSKLARAGASAEDVRALWRSVVEEIAKECASGSEHPAAASVSDPLGEFFDEYLAVVGERTCRARRAPMSRRRLEERLRV